MTTAPNADLQKKFRYHHGNLREAAITAALEILTRDGVAGLSLRALAKATGVTPTAFYESHFGDKDELLAAVAETGFQRLALQMAEDATGAPDVQTRVERLVTSYIRFATENRPLFQLMFGRELSDLKRFPTLAMTAGKSYSLISAALSKRVEGGEDARFLTVAIWSLCHGLTTLLVEDKLNPAQFGVESTEAFVKKTVALLGPHLA
ncbi:MAG TPA: TetR/AcrR family transcriptional regulator [Patescibacteria group bacterium]|nr:TetR/AcrR family transcriptional regulator [Patescibacteria group bacterium]